MGEIAEMMLDGTLCQCCGDFLGTDNGFPTYCADCQPEEEKIVKKKVGAGEKKFRQRVRKILIDNGFSNVTKIHPWSEIVSSVPFDSEIRSQQHNNNEDFKEIVLEFFDSFYCSDEELL